MEPVLSFEQVSKWYGGVIGVNHVTLKLQAGITGLVGANGSGKSTLLRLATGQLRPTLGRVTIRGRDAWSWQAKASVGNCPDSDTFYEDLTGRKFIQVIARLNGFPKQESHQRTEAVLERVGMADRADRRIRGYSKGMRQRIKLAQALLHDPELLVLDEPLLGIDPVGRQEMLDLFRSLAQQGKCLLISSHELEALEKLTDQVAIMARGRIAAVGTLTQIRDLLNDQPLTVRVDTGNARELARVLLPLAEVVRIDLQPGLFENAPGEETLVVQVRQPRDFFRQLTAGVAEAGWDVRRLEPLDDSAHAILGYILGGSGKT